MREFDLGKRRGHAHRTLARALAAVGTALATMTIGSAGQAFCGFYVAGADTSLYANATMVVLMREGTQTVISMQNNYDGPAEDFALVVPVPEVLSEEQVNTLPNEVFARVDQLGAPRLVEYFEMDPCQEMVYDDDATAFGGSSSREADAGMGVTIEAMFAVGEYDIVILSAEESDGLETWLVDNDYNIPAGSAEALAPYVEAGTKFFVANVDPERVTFENGQAALSPLRIAYNSEEFSLPIRLGLLNSRGTQDLIINILATSRYDVSNYDNMFIPTNIRVRQAVRDDFAGFYQGLFEETITANPNTVVTEYSWNAGSCDPCPTNPLDMNEIATLGGDVILGENADPYAFFDFTLTRLHYRYGPDSADEDLIFEEAPPVIGGRGAPDQQGEFQQLNTTSATFNNFQGRYALLNPWADEITCEDPVRGRWGGPDGSSRPNTQGSMNTALTGDAPEAANVEALLAEPIVSLGLVPDLEVDPLVGEDSGNASGGSSMGGGSSTGGLGPMGAGGTTGDGVMARRNSSFCSLSSAGGGAGLGARGLVLGAFGLWWARRRRN